MMGMLSCHSATALMEKKLRARLTLRERLGLFFHKLLCAACRRYEKQSQFLERLFKYGETKAPDEGQDTHDLEGKILRSLDEEKK
jgi:hypothetical protein